MFRFIKLDQSSKLWSIHTLYFGNVRKHLCSFTSSNSKKTDFVFRSGTDDLEERVSTLHSVEVGQGSQRILWRETTGDNGCSQTYVCTSIHSNHNDKELTPVIMSLVYHCRTIDSNPLVRLGRKLNPGVDYTTHDLTFGPRCHHTEPTPYKGYQFPSGPHRAPTWSGISTRPRVGRR